MGLIHEVEPRETDGRETILRFRMQFQAAAFAALEILCGGEVDKIYCDYHDDFVVRRTVGGKPEYHFFQVKTKEKLHKQFDLAEVFALKKKGSLSDPERHKAIRNSIAGKLFIHTIEFGSACHGVTLLSNVYFNDDVVDAVDDLHAGASAKKYISYLIDEFSKIFDLDPELNPTELKTVLGKFNLAPGAPYIGDNLEQFTDVARSAIWQHSEIDLRPHEIDEIAKSLIALIMNKSCDRLSDVKRADLELLTGVGLDDLLGVLSISTQVYRNLLEGEDPKAIKTASILQRQLKDAGASDAMIELASRLKVKWDVWHRSARHIYMELDLQALLDDLDSICSRWQRSGGKVGDLRTLIKELADKPKLDVFKTIDDELLFGGVCAAIVRRATR